MISIYILCFRMHNGFASQCCRVIVAKIGGDVFSTRRVIEGHEMDVEHNLGKNYSGTVGVQMDVVRNEHFFKSCV